MNGAEAALRTLAGGGVDVCFANPGTSEMHAVAALDAVPAMRGVLGLFEGVVTGAADGYGRMAGRPAATLLHLGPGFGNGIANLHNAGKARTGIVNLVGDHAGPHKGLDAPLESDIDGIVGSVSGWVRTPRRAEDVGPAVAAAVAAASGSPAEIATVILRADAAWSEGGSEAVVHTPAPPRQVDGERIEAIAKRIARGDRVGFLLGGGALTEPGLAAAGRLVSGGAPYFMETFPARVARGAGRVAIERLGYFAEQATEQLAGVEVLVLADAADPVSFFAYPGRPSRLAPVGCDVVALSRPGDDAEAALETLADLVAPGTTPDVAPFDPPARPTGALDAVTIAAAIGATLPEGAIVSDEAVTSGAFCAPLTANAAPHDWLALTGGAIGDGLPVAVGAAVARSDRRVLALEADGSAMYTIQALWTMARESLDVTVVLFSNHRYAILELEMDRVGAVGEHPKARSLLSLDNPPIDAVALARGFGVPAERAADAAHLADLLERSYATAGPTLIDVVL